MNRCPFCAILAGELPARRVYEDDWVVAFHDAAPQAPVHLLVIPRVHVQSASALEDPTLWSHLMTACVVVARQLGLDEGYRLVINCGQVAGQTVPHLHVHLLAGRDFRWPPG